MFIIKKPVLMLLKFLIIIFSLGAIISLLFALFGDNDILYIRSLEYCLLSAGCTLSYYLFNIMFEWTNPIRDWLEKRHEQRYFDREYRLDEYKNNRRFKETGYDEWSMRDYIGGAIAEQKHIQDINNQINNDLIQKN
jgi:hypothetical protein